MIREATEDDLKPLAALYKEHMIFHNKLDTQAYKVPSDVGCENKMEYFLHDSPYNLFHVLCHETDNVIDGFAVYMLLNTDCSEEKPDGHISVTYLFVTKNARRKGIGTELMNEVFKLAKENYCDCVTIDVNINNETARKFYKKMGMIPISIHMEKRI